MKLRQTARHFAARKALELPVVGDAVHDWLVDLHVQTFLERAPEERRAERREHLEALFDATVEMYLDALQAGHTEAQAREITHAVANFDFYRHGWTEMMEFPVDEVDDHYRRYEGYFEMRGIAVETPLGTFVPPGGLPDAPATPDAGVDADQPHAEGGFADDVYVQDESGSVQRGGREAPPDVSATDVPVVDGTDETSEETDEANEE